MEQLPLFEIVIKDTPDVKQIWKLTGIERARITDRSIRLTGEIITEIAGGQRQSNPFDKVINNSGYQVPVFAKSDGLPVMEERQVLVSGNPVNGDAVYEMQTVQKHIGEFDHWALTVLKYILWPSIEPGMKAELGMIESNPVKYYDPAL